MTTADPTQQALLLTVQRHDITLAQLAHRRKALPVLAEHAAAERKWAGLRDRLVAAETKRDDLKRELAKAEADVAVVATRAERDAQRLAAGGCTSKELVALESEVESLKRRQSILEDAELAIMEQLDTANAAVSELQAKLAEAAELITTLAADRDRDMVAIDADIVAETTRRSGAADNVGPDLLALYERIRGKNSGVGAAELVGRRCDGCRIELTPGDLETVRAAAPTTVLRCEECERILVRTDRSSV